ncbi:fungal-specific transcription factor domain-containing protein [Aspergillus bertholletiae]|uniref:Fungal-specific transcription factor domain-containing protein n=1 Tax=Aspergillus bertholletiae TaxID=1226010 RepID=A0A5N7AZR0_9EURO|nr:fungal-specific transcription factor domain-containing protein [Aspergillus bertholletiae]
MMNQSRSPGATVVRRAKACATCRRKKTKCDGRRPICSPCKAFNLPCAFQDVLRHSSRTSRAYVEELEKRVQDMESQLQDRTLDETRPGFEPEDKRHSSVSPLAVTGATSSAAVGSTAEPSADSEANQVPYVINAEGTKMRFFGASSGFSLPSSQSSNVLEGEKRSGAWMTASQRTASSWQLSNWYPRVLQGDHGQRAFQQLPSKSTILQLVGEYFGSFNRAMPLFDETTFRRLVDKQFGWNPDESPSWWASLNVVLASAYRERAQKLPDGSDEWQKSMGHIRNALNVVVELFMRVADLLAVQAMLGLALLFQNTPNPQPLFMFAAAAMRLSQSIGLHRNQSLGLSPSQIEERRRTFWVAFILDAEISHRTGRPPVQDVNDFDTPLPSRSPQDGLGIINVHGALLDYFHLLARFSLIQRQLYNRLYTTSVRTKTSHDLFRELKTSEEDLLKWRACFGTHYDSLTAFSSAPDYHLQHVLRLDFAYHCCYAKLYQPCILARRSMAQPEQVLEDFTALDKEIYDMLERSVESARSAVRLLPHVSTFGSCFAWGVIYFPAAASMTLLSNLLTNSPNQHAIADLAMVQETLNLLSKVSSEEPGTYVDYILGLCSELRSAAKKVVSQADLKTSERSLGHTKHTQPSLSETGDPENGFTVLSHAGVATPQPGDADLTRGSAISQTYEMPLVDPTFNLAMNFQWPDAPFWNWGDMMTGTSEGELGNEQLLHFPSASSSGPI